MVDYVSFSIEINHLDTFTQIQDTWTPKLVTNCIYNNARDGRKIQKHPDIVFT